MPLYITVFLFYNLLLSPLLGVTVVYLLGVDMNRLGGIHPNIKEEVFLAVWFSALLIIFFIALALGVTRRLNLRNKAVFENDVPSRPHLILYQCLFLINCIYIAFLFARFHAAIPLVQLLFGSDFKTSLSLARDAHLTGSISIPYISKFFDFLNLFLPLFGLTLYLDKRLGKLFLLLAYVVSISYLSMDLQKAPAFILLLLSLFITVQKKGLKIRHLLLFFVSATALVSMFSIFMSKSIGDMFLYLLDRPIFGQVQGMYYMFQYYAPSFDAFFTKFYFSNFISSITSIAPDVYIIDYVYPGAKHIVNVNTYFIGEAWAYGGPMGIIYFSILVGIIFFVYAILFSLFSAFHTRVSYIISFIFFATIPINQSLQFVVFQKYFLYLIIFFVIPLFMLFYVIRKWDSYSRAIVNKAANPVRD